MQLCGNGCNVSCWGEFEEAFDNNDYDAAIEAIIDEGDICIKTISLDYFKDLFEYLSKEDNDKIVEVIEAIKRAYNIKEIIRFIKDRNPNFKYLVSLFDGNELDVLIELHKDFDKDFEHYLELFNSHHGYYIVPDDFISFVKDHNSNIIDDKAKEILKAIITNNDYFESDNYSEFIEWLKKNEFDSEFIFGIIEDKNYLVDGDSSFVKEWNTYSESYRKLIGYIDIEEIANGLVDEFCRTYEIKRFFELIDSMYEINRDLYIFYICTTLEEIYEDNFRDEPFKYLAIVIESKNITFDELYKFRGYDGHRYALDYIKDNFKDGLRIKIPIEEELDEKIEEIEPEVVDEIVKENINFPIKETSCFILGIIIGYKLKSLS